MLLSLILIILVVIILLLIKRGGIIVIHYLLVLAPIADHSILLLLLTLNIICDYLRLLLGFLLGSLAVDVLMGKISLSHTLLHSP